MKFNVQKEISVNEKTKQLLHFIISRHPNASITELMKLAYLIDLVSVKEGNKQISNFEYKRYYYGPFDDKIYQILENSLVNGKIKAETKYSYDGSEYVVYSVMNEDFECDALTDRDREIARRVLEELKGYGAKTLTEIAYKTAPMKKIGATLGGNEGLNTVLNLSCD